MVKDGKSFELMNYYKISLPSVSSPESKDDATFRVPNWLLDAATKKDLQQIKRAKIQ